MSTKYLFPNNFLWGTATSAHQIEGDNKNSDWWEWEVTKPQNRELPKDPSGIACDSYNRYEEDFDLCKEMHNNAARFSIEWARVEPIEGKFDTKEIEHYKKVIKAAKQRGLKTFITLHHFTNPNWFQKKGGWVNPESPTIFKRYAQVCAKEFGPLADTFATFNEPQVLASVAYLAGLWPPQKHNPIESIIVQINLMRSHRAAYDAIKRLSDVPVGLVTNIIWFEAASETSVIDYIATKVLFFLNTDFFLWPIKNRVDFIGLNYYFTSRFKNLKLTPNTNFYSDIGWWINPQGIKEILLFLKKYKKPIYITENGLSDATDTLRRQCIKEHLIEIWKAIQAGVDVKGYFHWSLMDNFEWHQGYKPKFGLVEIDRENNLARKPRKSFYYYAKICKNNEVDGSEPTE
ncbi:glycoside hydrolase family 1 protein [candidate division WWE3 bacterium]|nr:glycoside hydrolase family 1 protein [candidate division WWE3 bacterium]